MRKHVRRIYGQARKALPASCQGYMTKMAFILGNKPVVRTNEIDPLIKFPNQEKGGLIISADFEMAWAWRYTKTNDDHLQKGRVERENFPRIIQVLEEYNIPITFATVGHLFLKECNKGEHEWMARIPKFINDNWQYTNGDWFDHDPYSNYKEAPEWYAPDLIQLFLNSEVEHEVGCHTFTHIDFSDKNCPSQVADDEIKACEQAARPYNVDLKSMVFPGGTWGNIDVLKKHGFKIYRKRCDFELSYPFRDKHGLLVSSSSGSLEHNLAYGWSADYFLDRLKKYIDKAMQTNTIAHLWFHPSLDPYFLHTIFPDFLFYAARQRGKGNLWIGTMKAIAEHINDNSIL